MSDENQAPLQIKQLHAFVFHTVDNAADNSSAYYHHGSKGDFSGTSEDGKSLATQVLVTLKTFNSLCVTHLKGVNQGVRSSHPSKAVRIPQDRCPLIIGLYARGVELNEYSSPGQWIILHSVRKVSKFNH